MTKNAVVSEDFASKFATEKETPYTRWVRSEGLDILPSFYVPDLHTVELKPWARRGGRGVYLNHDASRTSNDCYVCEVPPGGKLVVHDTFLHDELDGPLAVALYSAALFSRTEGRAYSAAECATWLREAGLTVQDPIATLAHSSLLVGWKRAGAGTTG